MRMAYLFLVGALLFWAIPAAAESVLVINASESTVPSVVDLEANTPLRSDAQGKWTYEIEFQPGQIVRRLKLSLENPPQGSAFQHLVLDHPFFHRGHLEVSLDPVPIESIGADTVRALWRSSVDGMSVDQLPEFYQRARHVALGRIAHVGNDWHRVSQLDVQSVYKYLEAAVILSQKMFVIPPEDISLARDWFFNASRYANDTINRAVGASAARNLLRSIDGEEATRFALLWREIVQYDCSTRKAYLEAYRDWYLKVPAVDRRQRIDAITGVPLGNIESAIAQCVAELAKATLASGGEREQEVLKTEIAHQINALQLAKEDEASKSLQRRLDSDIKSLSHILEAF